MERPCKPPWKVKLVSIVWGGLSACYVILYLAYNLTANHRLAKLPYGRYRTGHALFAWQVMSCHAPLTLGAASQVTHHFQVLLHPCITRLALCLFSAQLVACNVPSDCSLECASQSADCSALAFSLFSGFWKSVSNMHLCNLNCQSCSG